MSEIRIYVEGGRPGSEALMRKAFNSFFARPLSNARAKRIEFKVIASQSRNQAYKGFCHALTDHTNAINILLVDSEETVGIPNEPWKHLKQRDNWDNPGVDNTRCHLMVCVMESWFVADREILTKHFSKSLDTVPTYNNVETLTKQKIEEMMAKVSRGEKYRIYHKINDGTKLLERIRENIVREKAPHRNHLFETLDHIIENIP